MTLQNLRIAVVEDEVDLRDNMLDFLEDRGYDVWGVGNAADLYRQMLVRPVNVVILDVGLPGEDGFSIARHLRRMENLSLIIVSARSALDDRLTGLSCGADLYLTKPVDLRELEANIEAVVRRRFPGREAEPDTALLTVAPEPETGEHRAGAGNHEAAGQAAARAELVALSGVWRLDVSRWELGAPDGRVLPLTSKEFRFILPLVEANGETVSKANIAASLSLGRAGGDTASEYNRIDVLLARLRKKGLQTFGYPLPIKTVTAYGYALCARCCLA